jgi:[glutamine synthetase] adenylyltransferase / [glutamine synthetase]-adenylyl-L-tyrosine phosphorylase
MLAPALQFSRYAAHLVQSGAVEVKPELFEQPFERSAMRAALEPVPGNAEQLAERLRRLRQRVMLRLIVRDLSGHARLEEVLTTVTALAEETVCAALGFHSQSLAAEFGAPGGSRADQSLHVIGMGKLGGSELNVSSDIDLILLYPEEGETAGPRRISNHEYFTRLARRLIAALAEPTAEGFVFRVDTRLRPYGESGPLVMGFDALEQYFYTQGREWERYAWVKARAITGEREAEWMALAQPFVFRRHLDFSALESLRTLHAQIRQEVARRDIAENIKLGRGGIREIEFLVQVFQLIRGGTDPALRIRPTLAALAQLEAKALLPASAATELREAYRFLRNLEHRLQYLDDRQTQELPSDRQDRELIARAMRFADYAQFERALSEHRGVVSRHFEAIFATGTASDAGFDSAAWSPALDPQQAATRLQALGYRDAPAAAARLTELRTGGRYRRMSASGQAKQERLIPQLITAAARAGDPDTALQRLLQIVEAIGRRESYLALLLEYPHALQALARLAAASPWAAEYLARQPILLDELIAAPGRAAPDWGTLRAELRAALAQHGENTEQQMEVLRHFKHAQTLRLLMLDLAGDLPLETLSDHLSDLAAVLLQEVVRAAWNGLRSRHREMPAFAVIAYGKLGGKELGYASDLDIIFLYDDEHELAAENYARLAQRINTWLTSLTPAGVLYETDLRLRPNGIAGLLVSRVDAFRDYQFNNAWVWEHQALSRARFVTGDEAVGRRFESIRIEVLRRERDRAQLRKAVIEMREKMRAAHPNASGLFDLKHDPGGIVDVEFVVQYLVLGYSHAHAELTGNIGNLALLRLSAKLGLIPNEIAEAAHAAYRDFRIRQHALRLQGSTYARLPPDEVAAHAQAVRRLWQWVLEGEKA